MSSCSQASLKFMVFSDCQSKYPDKLFVVVFITIILQSVTVTGQCGGTAMVFVMVSSLVWEGVSVHLAFMMHCLTFGAAS